MNKPKNIKELLQQYKIPVNETEWQTIVDNPQVKRYNVTRHFVKIIKYPLLILASLLVIGGAVVLLHETRQAPISTDSEHTPTATVQPSLAASADESTTTTSSPSLAPSESTSGIVSSMGTVRSGNIVLAPSDKVPVTSALSSVHASATVSPVENPKKSPAFVSQATSLPQNSHISTYTEPATVAESIDESSDELSFPTTPSDQSQVIENRLFIPSAFTPNGDGLNDLFSVQANFRPATFEMTIFTKDGQRVFNARNIDIGWDGQYRGQSAPQNIYIYLIKYTFPDGTIKTEKGQILLLK